MIISTRTLSIISDKTTSFLRTDVENKLIICCNIASRVDNIKPDLDTWLDAKFIIGDVCSVTGKLDIELKTKFTTEFKYLCSRSPISTAMLRLEGSDCTNLCPYLQ